MGWSLGKERAGEKNKGKGKGGEETYCAGGVRI